MARKKRKFIDKKKAITFTLVHRSQKDPLTADENAPKRVLQPVENDRKDDLEKYGIFFDDDYDYMQHLKESTTGTDLVRVEHAKQPRVEIAKAVKKGDKTVLLPSSVFPSEIEARVGLLNKAAPKGLQLDLDPEIVATFDDDFDFDDPENEFEDDFVLQLNGGAACDPEEIDGSDMDEDFDDVTDEESDDENMMMSDDEFEREETKSRFTEYSMSSSVIRRNEQLTMLDNRFEKENFELDKTAIRQFSDSDSEGSDCSIIEIKPKEKWDCESILSTYTDIYNHPKMISVPKTKRIKIDPKTGLPVDDGKLTKSALSQLDDNSGDQQKKTGPGSIASIVSTLSNRPKNETPEERASRKKAFKDFRKERRMERKCNKEAFKEEKKRMEKVVLNTNKGKHQIPL
ncbi:unnamed protein product [Nesidiocoris tenuis]|uniref:Protein LTV1 homolog n=1 Tax=Nesidiocoris tenuis TaxID=355587 RepID=A0A6H5GT97_9HEMI|nr:unnamed protein product [Nesidiocoris tenuis]